MIEIFARRQLIASHVRLFKRGARATLDAHRPANHRAIIDTTIERLLQRAEAIAPSVAQVLREQFNRKRHPEEALRVAQGILRLAQDFSPQQLAAACERALTLKACNYRSVRALITHAAHRIWRGSPVIPRARERARARVLPLTETFMLIEPMIQQLHQLRLRGMAAGLEQLLRSAQHASVELRGTTERDDPARDHRARLQALGAAAALGEAAAERSARRSRHAYAARHRSQAHRHAQPRSAGSRTNSMC